MNEEFENPIDPDKITENPSSLEYPHHLGNVLEVITDRKLAMDDGVYDPISGVQTSSTPDGYVDHYTADVIQYSDYFPFGSPLPGRSGGSSSDLYRFGFNGMEMDDEVKNSQGTSYDFGARMYDPRVGRFLSLDPLQAGLVVGSNYSFALNTPIQAVDFNGEFSIFINGRVGADSERASSTYWDKSHISAFEKGFGYKFGGKVTGNEAGKSKFSGDFLFVDGDRGATFNQDRSVNWSNYPENGESYASFPAARTYAGVITAKADADMIWDKLKESVNKDGQITEQIQVLSHSRGGAFADGYVEELKRIIAKKSKSEGIGFAYDEGLVIDLVVHLAPHQSNYINVKDSKTTTIGVSHKGDWLSDMDITGDVVNIETTQGYGGAFDVSNGSHKNSTFKGESAKIISKFKENKMAGKPKYSGYDGLLKQQSNYSKGE